MLLLTSTSDILRVVTSAAADVRVHADYADLSSGVVSMGRTNTPAISTATTTTVVGSPAASTTRNVKALYVRNHSASTSCDVTVEHFDGATSIPLKKSALSPGESLDFIEGMGFVHLMSDGAPVDASSPSMEATNSADQALAAADTYIVGSALPIGGRLKSGSMFRWAFSVTKTAAGAATPIWSVRIGTAGTTADTARLTFTGLAQTAAADTGVFRIEMAVRSVGAAGVVSGYYLLVGHTPTVAGAPTTGFATQAVDAKQATSAGFDNASSGLIVGVSVNAGASSVWTVKDVVLRASNLT